MKMILAVNSLCSKQGIKYRSKYTNISTQICSNVDSVSFQAVNLSKITGLRKPVDGILPPELPVEYAELINNKALEADFKMKRALDEIFPQIFRQFKDSINEGHKENVDDLLIQNLDGSCTSLHFCQNDNMFWLSLIPKEGEFNIIHFTAQLATTKLHGEKRLRHLPIQLDSNVLNLYAIQINKEQRPGSHEVISYDFPRNDFTFSTYVPQLGAKREVVVNKGRDSYYITLTSRNEQGQVSSTSYICSLSRNILLSPELDNYIPKSKSSSPKPIKKSLLTYNEKELP